MTLKDTPNIRNFEVTSYCNLNCPICVEKNFEKGYLKKELLINILSANKEIVKNQTVWLHYRGEPLLHHELLDFILFFNSYGVKTRLSTNGILLEGILVEKLLESHLDGLVVSMLSNNPIVYKQLRGAESFEKVKRNLINLIQIHESKNSNVKIQIMGLDYGQGEEEISQFVKFYHNLGINVAIHKYSDRLQESRYIPEQVTRNVLSERLPCKWLYNDMIILFDGKVTVCYYDLSSKLVIGNLKDYDYSITELWNCMKYNKMRKEHGKLIFSGPCNRCNDWIYEYPGLDRIDNSYVTLFNKKE
jgi:molybdenum cofactor biosynthesis enzyme MoaA